MKDVGREELLANELNVRLEEAEETLRAIHKGEVDALVVSGPDGEKIYTLQGADEPYRVFVEAMNEGAVTLTADGTIFYCNRRFSEIVRGVHQRIIGSSLRDWVSPEDQDLVAGIFDHGKGSGKGEVRLRTAAGEEVPALISISPLNLDSTVVACAVITDTTEKKEAEAKITEYVKKLELSNKELENFAFVASHDLQEPLRKIQVLSDLFRAKGKSENERMDYAGRMQRTASRMSLLLRSLLAYSRVSTTSQPPEPIDLSEVVREAVSNLEVRLQEVDGKVDVLDLPVVEGDRQQMTQLFQNLIGNAMKFHCRDIPPRVRIYSRLVGKTLSGDRRFEIDVEDNGSGFEEKYLDRIFMPFERLSTQCEGAGMGLAICKKIVERHGGSITAKSRPGKGSTFIIRLPEKQKDR
ncbi:MAG: PAS domain S-box protein [Desulfobacteraceae bacterium]|nr:MAG: PAS domain S-box protein [Desulfobacteraceae bacterium]